MLWSAAGMQRRNTQPSHEHRAGEWCGAGSEEEEEEEVEGAHMGNSSPAEGRLVLLGGAVNQLPYWIFIFFYSSRLLIRAGGEIIRLSPPDGLLQCAKVSRE